MPILLISLCFFLLAFYFRKKILATYVLLFYGVGTLSGFFMTVHSYFAVSGNSGYQPVNYEATIFLFICCLFLFFPLLNMKDKGGFVAVVNRKHFLNISYFVIFVSILYCLLIIPYLSLALNVLDFVAYKNEVMEEGGLDISSGNPLLAKLFGFQTRFRPFIPFMLFYALSFIKGKRLLKILLCIVSVLPVFLNSLASAHRHILVYSLIQFFVCFLLFRKYLSSKTYRMIIILVSLVVVSVIVVVVYFAVLRFDDGGEAVMYSLLRYLGEPFVDFNTMLWGNDQYLYGNKSFTYVRLAMGLDAMDPNNMREQTYFLRYLNYYFYSAIGNFYMDFGPIGSLVVSMSIGLFFNWILNIKIGVSSLTRLLILYLYAIYTIQNYFYFQFMGAANIYFLWIVFFVVTFHFYIFKVRKRSSSYIR